MPIYEYQCRFCEHKEDVLQKVSDPLIKKCPQCGKNGFEKLVSAPSFQLKGTGWYATDFKDKPVKKVDKSTEATETKSPAKETTSATPSDATSKSDTTKTKTE